MESSSDLPSLAHKFGNANIETVSVGPRREVTLSVSPLVWEGSNGRYAEPVPVRFGGIRNFEEVSTFFAAPPHQRSELAALRYAAQPQSKPGHLFVELVFERIDATLVIECSSLMVGQSAD